MPPPPPRRSLSQDRDEASLLIPRRRLAGSSNSSRSPMRAGSINGGASRPHTLPTPPPQQLSNNNTSSSSSLAFSPTVRNRANPFITNNLSSSSSNPILRPSRGSSSHPHPPPPPTTSSSFELTSSPPTAHAPRNLGGRTMSSSSPHPPPPSPLDFGASSSSSASPSSPFARRLRNSVTLSRSDMDLDELSGPWTTSSVIAATSASSPLPPSSSNQQQQQQRAPFSIPPFVHTREIGGRSSSRHRFGGSGGAEVDDEDYYDSNDEERMASSHVAGGGEDRGVTSIFGINARRNSSSSSFAGRRLPPPSTSIAERGGGGGGSRRPQSGTSFSSGIPRMGVQRGRDDDDVDVVVVLDSDEEEQRGYGGGIDPMDGYDATAASFLNRLSSTTSDGGRRGVSHSNDDRAHLRRVEDARRDVRRLMGEQRDQLSHLRRLREEARERREDLTRTLTAEATLQRSVDDHHRRLPSNIQTISSGDDEDDDDDAPPRDTCPSFWFTGSCPDEGRCPFLHTLGRNALSLQRAATNRRERLQASQRRMGRTPLFPSSSSSSLAAPSTGLSTMPISTDRADSLLALSTRLSMLRERVEEVFPAPGGVIIRTGYSESNGPLSGLVGSLLQFLETAGDQAVMASLLSSIAQGGGGGASVPRGVPEDQLHKLETFQCPTAKGGVGASSSSSPSTQFPSSSMFNPDIAPDTSSEANGCSICLCDLSDKPDGSPTTMSAPSSSSAPDIAVMLARMPNCRHVFHEACLTMWLKSSTTCPLCRGEFSLVEAVASPSTLS